MEEIWEVRIFAHRKWLYRTDRGSHQLNLNTEKAVSLTAGRYVRFTSTGSDYGGGISTQTFSFSEFYHINGTVFFYAHLETAYSSAGKKIPAEFVFQEGLNRLSSIFLTWFSERQKRSL